VFLKQRWGLARGDCSARRTFIRQSAHEIGRGCEKGPGGLDESPALIAATQFDVKCSQVIPKLYLSRIKQL
jgi:hypothetical protein